jgi:aspartate/methionine/tyrosine aminotransferase
MPDLDDIRNKVRFNDSIAGILLLSPDNPTGAVYPREVLEEIAEIARENDIFVIADEIYANIVYDGGGRLHMSEWIGDVPGIAMRGISKEYPWPGARCGWLEVLNKGRDHAFGRYVDSLIAAKRLEVSSTTLPQMSIPLVMSDARYPGHLAARELMFSERADEVAAVLEDCEHIIFNKPSGAFYYTVMFKEGVLRNDQTLPIANPRARETVERMVAGVEPDKRFVYYLMGATGIVVVPLTGFQCTHHGFRGTLLETDDAKRAWILKSVREAIDQYVESGSAAHVVTAPAVRAG